MPGTTILALDGVLAGRPDEPVDLAMHPLELAGASLYAALSVTAGRLVLATNLERRQVSHWCRQNGLYQHDAVVPLDLQTVTRQRAGGENVTLYVDCDGERTAAALRQGVPTLLFARPLYARAGFRPDLASGQRPWAQVVAESRAQRSARRTGRPDEPD